MSSEQLTAIMAAIIYAGKHAQCDGDHADCFKQSVLEAREIVDQAQET